MKSDYDYVIVGGGLAGASAVEGIRERDAAGSILLIGEEVHLPYDRPPLSKKLWFGKKNVEDIFLHDRAFYDTHGVALALGAAASRLDPAAKRITLAGGATYGYGKLLLATGCKPRHLDIPGGDLDGICYFRDLDDYLHTRGKAAEGKSAVVVGGGFIGSELAAALNINKLDVTMIFPGELLCDRVLPDYLGRAVQQRYQEKGVRILASDKPVSFGNNGNQFVTRTWKGETIASDIVIVGVGVVPDLELARSGGLEVGNGIVVNEYLETSSPDIYAAGDNAFFPYRVLGQAMRIEHWDHALIQGRWAGRNMAGAHEPYTHLPYFFSDLFEFGYEATGEVDSRLETFADWQKENETGVIYYLRDGKVRGVMMCNVWDKVETARELIRKDETVSPEKLRGLIR
ncbi:N-acylamino acid racemase [Ferrigenium kumadai]|uniref:N-acylamino acid racemase n=1 Tax=Ferrigenium kumadai TaxID=1682490 RepID=A0AAN1T025_9PROT|nr:FAD-dependent oxidoreductase [Ferrigenium kumadai]BBI99967.1 N-acylamino acid racemase [Ferrigenium kumadai]